ncbi:MAG: ABC transporter permease [Salinimicrobium sp.]
MIRNYFKIAWRNFHKNLSLSLITLGGLSIGITAVLLIGLYINGQTNYEDFQQNKSSLYRVGFHYWQKGEKIGDGSKFTPPFGPDAQNEFPEIKSFTRLSSQRLAYISYKGKTIKLENIHHADSSFFQLFSYKLLKGNSRSVLREPYSIVLTEETANKIFGTDTDVIGKVVRLNNQTDYMVSGIAREAPANSHLSFNALLSFTTLYKESGNYMDWNGGQQYTTYLQLKDGANSELLEKKLPAFMWKHINRKFSEKGFRVDASLQPLEDIHLYYSDASRSLRTNIYVFAIVALLILIISSVNYINLTTAQAVTRFKEIGVRKVLGARHTQLIKQFLIETTLLTSLAFLISLVLITLLIPIYQQTTGTSLPSLSANSIPALMLLFILIMIVGIIAGSYVAFYISSFNATKIFKGLLPQNTQGTFRKGLIVAQFAITIGLLICTSVVSLQLIYSNNSNPGFDKNQIIVVPLIGEETQQKHSLVQQKLLQIPQIQQVSALSEIPYDGITSNGFVPEGETEAIVIHQLNADENFLKTFNISLVEGEFFAKDRSIVNDGYVINETLAKTLGWQDPLGKTIGRDGEHKVVGVIKDFHFASLHDKIEPLIITNKPWANHYSYLAIKYQKADVSSLINDIRQTWKNDLGGAPFDYWFLDEVFNKIYKSEERFQQIFIYFSAISIILSLAGVFGLVALTIKLRTKEFGIRKVLGAGLFDIIKLTTKSFVIGIGLASLIATPIVWYVMNKWLQNFAYRISISWWIFVICSLTILLITILTISVQAVKAAIANPSKSLRTE